MRIRPSTSFPYPVLCESTGDYADSRFDITLDVLEAPVEGSVVLEGTMTLDDEGVQEVIGAGKAKTGLMITCLDTYLDRFVECPLEGIKVDLSGGQVRGTVYVRGVVIAAEDELSLGSGQINAEFPTGAKVVRKGDFIALTSEMRFEAGLEKLAPLESIFRLKKSEDVQEGQFEIDCDSEAIEILASPSLYTVLYNLRQTSMKDLLLPALYLPVVMSVLDAMRQDDFADRRWYSIMRARCEVEGIDIKGDLAVSAQKLLDGPLDLLKAVIERGS